MKEVFFSDENMRTKMRQQTAPYYYTDLEQEIRRQLNLEDGETGASFMVVDYLLKILPAEVKSMFVQFDEQAYSMKYTAGALGDDDEGCITLPSSNSGYIVPSLKKAHIAILYPHEHSVGKVPKIFKILNNDGDVEAEFQIIAAGLSSGNHVKVYIKQQVGWSVYDDMETINSNMWGTEKNKNMLIELLNKTVDELKTIAPNKVINDIIYLKEHRGQDVQPLLANLQRSDIITVEYDAEIRKIAAPYQHQQDLPQDLIVRVLFYYRTK